MIGEDLEDFRANRQTAFDNRSRLDRFYNWLGFGEARAGLPPQAVRGAAYGGSRTVFRLTLGSRLRVLVSGKIMVDMAHMMDAPPKIWQSTSAFSVLPPNYPMDDGEQKRG